MYRLVLLIIMVCFSGFTFAKIYVCKDIYDALIYQDIPCFGDQVFKKVLNIEPKSRETIAQRVKRNQRELNNLRKENQRYLKNRINREITITRNDRLIKQQQRRKTKQLKRCEMVRTKTTLLEKRLKERNTARQLNSINRKLAEYRILAKNYCSE